jgi:hypothetical protein
VDVNVPVTVENKVDVKLVVPETVCVNTFSKDRLVKTCVKVEV